MNNDKQHPRYSEWHDDTTAQEYGTPFRAWLAAAYPAEHATTASATPTITRWDVCECTTLGGYSDMETAKDGLYVEYSDHLAALEARAEEARREGAIIGHADGISFGKKMRESMGAEIAELSAKLAAAAPGREAGPLAITDETGLNGIKWYVTPPKELRNGVNLYAHPQPVAEAAAQADDGIEIQQHHVYVCRLNPRAEYAGRPVKPQLLPLVGKLLLLRADWGNADDDPYPGEWAMSRANGARIAGVPWIASGDVEVLGEVDEAEVREGAAAPTAQPTPCPFLGSSSMTRGVGTARELRAAMEAAQPTLQDDVAPAFEAWFDAVPEEVWSRAVALGHVAAAFEGFKAGAALRQPGALPDDTPYCKPCGIYCATDSCPLCSRTTAPRVTIAAKQAGK